MMRLPAMLAAFLSTGVLSQAAPEALNKSDVEISHALIGQWEGQLHRKDYPVTRLFISYEASGTFKDIAIIDLLAQHGREETEGKWRVANGKLIEEVLRVRGKSHPFYVSTEQIMSLREDVVLLRTEDGEQEEMRRCFIPTHLPPLMSRSAIEQIVIEKPEPAYPSAARRNRMEGEGAFKLYVNEKTGIVTSIRTLRSTGHRLLDEAAIGALKNWRFRPETVQRLVVPFTFQLPRG